MYLTSVGEEFLNQLAAETDTNVVANEMADLTQTSSRTTHLTDQHSCDMQEQSEVQSNTEKNVSQEELRVMVVDDEPDTLLSYKVNLESCGFFTFAAQDASVALNEFQKDIYRYDLVLSDIRMKRMNGLELFAKLKRLRPDVSIILTSALDAGPELASVLPGFDTKDFLEKPIDRDTLVRKVTQIVMQRKSASQPT